MPCTILHFLSTFRFYVWNQSCLVFGGETTQMKRIYSLQIQFFDNASISLADWRQGNFITSTGKYRWTISLIHPYTNVRGFSLKGLCSELYPREKKSKYCDIIIIILLTLNITSHIKTAIYRFSHVIKEIFALYNFSDF